MSINNWILKKMMSASFVLICKNMFVKLVDMSCVIYYSMWSIDHTDSKDAEERREYAAKVKWLKFDAYCIW